MSPTVSVVMPVYNVQAFVGEAIESVLAQRFTDFELILVNDCATDNSLKICQQVQDRRVRIVQHKINKGLAAARNTGVRHAIGKYVAFLDSDDKWHPDKLARHVEHLDRHPLVGISFSRSAFMEHDGTPTNFYQMPQLNGIDAAHLLCRNPVGNGSAPVIRRETLNAIRFQIRDGEGLQSCYFDESFRQSEDIECWLRIVATTSWLMAGIPEPLTYYRLNPTGLSADVNKQLASWEKMITKARLFAPKVLKQHERHARGYQLRYLARQSIRSGNGKMAVHMVNRALIHAPQILLKETGRTLTTLGAAYLLWLLPKPLYQACEQLGQEIIGRRQRQRIAKDGVKGSLISQ
ncbi:glycosyltransferase [Shewanella rhizosphaerae]|uniref:glycosyltransferase family 2 protein n=1 Tax=Shewanella rhizosphaerae TaxID=2864207 RepID=UPI001C65AB2E|nr:glycosyltransferase family 2 protein [Shewanella rhizosphaerae]QYK14278.1 glycosyltransferase [Shewanella rhizosphaerae]